MTAIRWILLIWSVMTVPFVINMNDIPTTFYGLLYLALVINLTAWDLRDNQKKN
jgi:hypothetical protein